MTWVLKLGLCDEDSLHKLEFAQTSEFLGGRRVVGAAVNRRSGPALLDNEEKSVTAFFFPLRDELELSLK